MENTAHVSYTLAGVAHDAPSNTVITSLVALIDVENTALAAQTDTLPSEASGYSYSFRITNTGSDVDQYELAAAFTDRSGAIDSLWIDSNHNHRLDEGDARISDAALPLAAGASADVLVLSATRGTMGLTVTSTNDDPAAVIRHQHATAAIALENGQGDDAVTLTKSQSVDTQGAAAPNTGSLITYDLTAHIPARAGLSDGVITDAIPAGTTYVSGSLTFDGSPLTDIADSDNGAFDTARKVISVTLPATMTNPDNAANHTVRFQVRIN
ncbi:MAG: hypothetical protein QM647_14150 [Asticcacaulis sp.]|uniref:hypothetical protein n=1 Tax=Asticcacaulis sp. TaxID=1872648 RepID=UPI0039E46F59